MISTFFIIILGAIIQGLNAIAPDFSSFYTLTTIYGYINSAITGALQWDFILPVSTSLTILDWYFKILMAFAGIKITLAILSLIPGFRGLRDLFGSYQGTTGQRVEIVTSR